MKKLLILFLVLSIKLFPTAITKYYNDWKVRNIAYDNSDNKTVTITMDKDKQLKIYMAFRSNQVSISITWYKDKIDENIPIVQYKLDNSKFYTIKPIMRSSSDNFDILYTISPAFGIFQEKELLNFLNALIGSKNLKIRPNDYGDYYDIETSSLKDAIKNTDFTGTLFEKYKYDILK